LKRRIERAGLNQSQFAGELELNASVVNRWLSGQAKPNAENAARVADYFGVPRGEVYALVGIPAQAEGPITTLRSFDERLTQVLADRPIAIPIHDQQAAAGFGQEILDYAYWSPPKAAGRHIIGVQIRGRSMEPDLQEGDIVYVDTDREPEPGRTVVATIGDQVVVKKLRKRAGRLVLVGNDGSELSTADAHLVGVVIHFSRDMA
jgi:SOS-response transcriptional repressor LexA